MRNRGVATNKWCPNWPIGGLCLQINNIAQSLIWGIDKCKQLLVYRGPMPLGRIGLLLYFVYLGILDTSCPMLCKIPSPGHHRIPVVGTRGDPVLMTEAICLSASICRLTLRVQQFSMPQWWSLMCCSSCSNDYKKIDARCVRMMCLIRSLPLISSSLLLGYHKLQAFYTRWALMRTLCLVRLFCILPWTLWRWVCWCLAILRR